MPLWINISVLEVKIQRMDNTMNFSRPHLSSREQRVEIDCNRAYEQCNDAAKNVLLQC
jgi:hypothetical protein